MVLYTPPPPDALGRRLDRLATKAPRFIDVHKGFAALVASPVLLAGGMIGSAVVAALGVVVGVVVVRRYHPDSRHSQ